MKRVYAQFTDEQFNIIEKEAKEAGMSIAKFVSYNTLLNMDLPVVPQELQKLYNEVDNYISTLHMGDTFICSSTIERWYDLSRSDKMIVSLYIAKLARDKSNGIAVYKKKSGSVPITYILTK